MQELADKTSYLMSCGYVIDYDTRGKGSNAVYVIQDSDEGNTFTTSGSWIPHHDDVAVFGGS
jgi:hypothetical protein